MSKTINVYQVFTRLFRNDTHLNKPFGTLAENGCSKFDHFTSVALESLKEFGITHIWFTGIIRHATCTSYEEYGIPANNPFIVKGVAGSPYAITDYYDVDPDLAVNPANRMKEFESLIKRCHDSGLKVIIDFVPNHVARQYKSRNLPEKCRDLGSSDIKTCTFHTNNNFYYIPDQEFKVPELSLLPYTANSPVYHEIPAKATGNNAFTASPCINDWYETIKLNYGIDYQNGNSLYFNSVPDTWTRMLEIMRFWTQKGIDGLRCDMSEMVPVEFWRWSIPQVRELNNNLLFIAEVYNPDEYRNFLNAGFDYLYDKVGLYDILRSLVENHGSTYEITRLWQRYEGYQDRMLRFLENHDEQRIASSFFAGNPWKAMPAMVLAATMCTGPLMLYFGQEIGEKATESEGFSGMDGRTTIFDYWCVEDYQKWVNHGNFNCDLLDSDQKKLRDFYSKLNHLRLVSKAINSGGYYDLMWVNYHNPDSHLFYAYLRHFDKEVFLFVLNFNQMCSMQLKLIIPKDAFSAAEIPLNKKYTLTDIFDNHNYYLDPDIAISEGLSITIKESTPLILRFSADQ